MANITEFDILPINELKNKLELYKYNPSNMQRVILDTLSDITDGRINIVDPTNPFVFLLEASTVNASLFIQENYLNLRRQYPSLAQEQSDLYLHMCDKDYIGRFATSGRTRFTVAISYSDLDKAPYDASLDANKFTIPKDTEVTVDNLKYTFSYAIDIIKYANNMIRIQYNTNEQNPLMPLSNSLINYIAKKNAENDIWVFFDIELLQVEIKSVLFNIEVGNVFTKTIPFNDQYSYCRVYYRGTSTLNRWKEIKTTHTDMVYDINDPTVLLQVYSNELKVVLPSIYATNNLLSGDLRVDIYSTKGDFTADLSNFKLTAFSTVLRSLGDDDEINQYVDALSNSSYLVYSDKITTGGSNGIDFNALRTRVINNATGDRQLPISPVQLETYVNDQGFELVKNIDIVTNRIFLATKKLPAPSNKAIITPATLGITNIVINPATLVNNFNVVDNHKRITIKSNSLFKLTNGVLHIVNQTELNNLNALPDNDYIEDINTNSYYYTPFYYVYDEENINEHSLRIYHLDQPKINYINFMNQNNTLQASVNSGSVSIEKLDLTYKITVTTRSGFFYQQLPDNKVALQLAYYPVGESTLAYINATLVGRTPENERIYEIILDHTLDINEKDLLVINNAHMFDNSTVNTNVKLTQDFYLIYSTDSIPVNFVSGPIDAKVGNIILSPNFMGITEEIINVSLGYPLTNLWSMISPIANEIVYKRYTADIPLLYDRTIYKTDPTIGSIFGVNMDTGRLNYEVLHNMNDPVIVNGQPVYKHRAGDVVLDVNNEPIIEAAVSVNSNIDMLLVDAKYLLARNDVYKDYRKSIADIIHTWCSVNIEAIQELLLEQTRIYFYPTTTFSSIKVLVNKTDELRLSSEVFFDISLYFNNSGDPGEDLRKSMTSEIVMIVDNYLTNRIISTDDIALLIKDRYSTMLDSVQIKGLNNNDTLYNLEILEEHKRFNLHKKLILESDGNIYVTEDVTIHFVLKE